MKIRAETVDSSDAQNYRATMKPATILTHTSIVAKQKHVKQMEDYTGG